MDLGIKGKKALVCAASKGLGRSIAKALAGEGVELFMCAREEGSLNEAAEAIRQIAASPVHSATADLMSAAGRERLIETVRAQMGDPDILIHNIGGPPPSMVEETSIEAWENGFQRLFASVIHLNQAFIPPMKQKRWGRVMTVTSTSIYQPISGLAVSNGLRPGLTAMLKNWADEVAADGVTINCIAPGVIHTDRTEERIQAQLQKQGGTREEYLAQYAREIPMKRLGQPDEFGPVVAFLCSRQASYMTGVTVCVDGGKHRFIY